MPDLARKPEIDASQGGLFGWKADLLVYAVGEVSLVAGLVLFAGLISRKIMLKNSGALPGQQVV
jgi:hypothetical protein